MRRNTKVYKMATENQIVFLQIQALNPSDLGSSEFAVKVNAKKGDSNSLVGVREVKSTFESALAEVLSTLPPQSLKGLIENANKAREERIAREHEAAKERLRQAEEEAKAAREAELAARPAIAG